MHLSSRVFASFVNSKPPGRKTVVGKTVADVHLNFITNVGIKIKWVMRGWGFEILKMGDGTNILLNYFN